MSAPKPASAFRLETRSAVSGTRRCRRFWCCVPRRSHLVRTLIYKRTHNGDPDDAGCFGCRDCMGRVRSWHFQAVIGVGGLGADAHAAGIAEKLTWIGIGPPQEQRREAQGAAGDVRALSYARCRWPATRRVGSCVGSPPLRPQRPHADGSSDPLGAARGHRNTGVGEGCAAICSTRRGCEGAVDVPASSNRARCPAPRRSLLSPGRGLLAVRCEFFDVISACHGEHN
jgi:hypothetical protein